MEETRAFNAIVLRHALQIVQHERRITGAQMAKELGITQMSYYKLAKGTRPIRKVSFLGYLALLEEIRERRTRLAVDGESNSNYVNARGLGSWPIDSQLSGVHGI